MRLVVTVLEGTAVYAIETLTSYKKHFYKIWRYILIFLFFMSTLELKLCLLDECHISCD